MHGKDSEIPMAKPSPARSKSPKAKKPGSAIEQAFAFQLRAVKLAEPVREFRFHPIRLWRFDFAWPDKKLAVECEGGVWVGGRHTQPSGFLDDCEKYNAAALLGWRVLRFPSAAVKSGAAINMTQEALA